MQARDAATGRVRVTIVMEYEPEPESYTYQQETDEDLPLAEMIRQDELVFTSGGVAVEELLEWGDVVSVDFEAAR